jgi:hypothetical protein
MCQEERIYSSDSFLTSVLDGGEWSASHPGRVLAPGKDPPPHTHWTEGWVGPRACLDTEARQKSFRFCRWSNLDHPVVQSAARQYTVWATPAT